MPTKKLFPGVSEQDVQKKEAEQEKLKQAQNKKREAALKVAKEKAEQAQKKAEEREFNDMVTDFYKKFGDRMNVYKTEMKEFVIGNLFFLASMYGMWGIGHAGDNNGKGLNIFKAAISTSDIEAAEKIYEKTGSKTLALGSYLINPVKETYDFSTIFKKESYDVFKNDNDWKLVRAYFGLMTLISFAIGGLNNISADKKKKIEEIKRALKYWNEQDFDGLEANTFPNKNHYSTTPFVNPDMVAKIISHLSSKDATFFNQMLSGEKEVPLNVAVKIMEGHLQSHPEDLQMILDSFDERSIPDEIKNLACSQKNR